jgi:hypothetical protein
VINRLLVRTLFAACVAVVLVPTAAADGPTRDPLPFTDVTGQFCEDFQVLVHATQNKEVATVFSSGAALVTGVLKVEVTNLESGKTLALNISGPGVFSADGTEISGAGTWLLFGEAGQLPGPDPGLLLVTGRNSLALGPAGITSITVRGTTQDVCAALAA